ncbi:hypothetical protein NEA10_20535 (plasmid) [Phormidium yuhuli AB48]|uniref:GIY-YIG domain-containing protein n=1 Tax=Phormidium yuhuli AB48 TaxID=2940671 RepID=A0ABY5AWR2_9CYAN|nr:GIY-YIG nuclease family protein [Phormidium yuhuli]USR93295.1 hypothetical protein NEA10_20535 [Phormidium yuhuli AB48]
MNKQLSLFDTPYNRPIRQEMTGAQLVEWQGRIANYQRQALKTPSPKQTSLFDLGEPTIDPDTINPYTLGYQNLSFYRMPRKTLGHPCIYFVTDLFVPIVLYIGESKNHERRWRGEHDCKDYLSRYASLLYRNGQRSGAAIAFWLSAPAERKPRQTLEKALIQKWQPPFNKECWEFWGQPFPKI